MEPATGVCNLGGNAESKVVFEPVTLTAEDIAKIFSDKKSKKFLTHLKSLDFDKLKGKLILIEEGVVAVCRQLIEKKALVLVKIIGKEEDFLMAYEVEDSRYRIYLESESFELSFKNFCWNSPCWAVPVYVMFPSLYPELCDNEVCKRFTNT
ncbi:MAG: hypothetical protein H0Z19_07050 [Archaeoglobus sp.]|uniref:hypothetical protein n=1 Tax=Archaeoglobus sp. TaxID=1872626 RepID=UPI001DD4B820|nr:hypothetical protein [Archaeoglobus sp.]MBO8180222.1 hypothetical protein [Archaeoglobus sp.]